MGLLITLKGKRHNRQIFSPLHGRSWAFVTRSTWRMEENEAERLYGKLANTSFLQKLTLHSSIQNSKLSMHHDIKQDNSSSVYQHWQELMCAENSTISSILFSQTWESFIICKIIADSIKVALGIGNWQLGFKHMVWPANNSFPVPIPNEQTNHYWISYIYVNNLL